MLNFNVTFSPTVVVALSGPGLLPFSAPNLDHFCLSATAWSTMDFCNVRLILRMTWQIASESSWLEKNVTNTLTFFPSSLIVYFMVVRIPFSSTYSSFFGNSEEGIRDGIKWGVLLTVFNIICPWSFRYSEYKLGRIHWKSTIQRHTRMSFHQINFQKGISLYLSLFAAFHRGMLHNLK